ncbi:hypothetical protein ACJJTC_000453 [Scirpophaga incertulas]
MARWLLIGVLISCAISAIAHGHVDPGGVVSSSVSAVIDSDILSGTISVSHSNSNSGQFSSSQSSTSQSNSSQSSESQANSNQSSSSQSQSTNSQSNSSEKQSSSNQSSSSQSSSSENQSSSSQSSSSQSSNSGNQSSSSQNSSSQSSSSGNQSSSNQSSSSQSSSSGNQSSSSQSSSSQSSSSGNQSSSSQGSSSQSSSSGNQSSSSQGSSSQSSSSGNQSSSSQNSSSQSSSSGNQSSSSQGSSSQSSISGNQSSSSQNSSSQSSSSGNQSSSSQGSSSQSSSNSQSSNNQLSSQSSNQNNNQNNSSNCSKPKPKPSPCGINEDRKCVQPCPPQKSCENRNAKYFCPAVIRPCKWTCVCKPGYLRNAIGECITEAQCNKCSKPNEFYSCGGACDNECSTLGKQNRTNCPIINIKCNPKCYCKDGFARDDKDNCIPVDKCKKKPEPLQCDANEVVDDCPYKCGSERCPRSEQEAKLSPVCVKPDKCPPPACRCRFNYSRDKNGKCIPTRNCPAFPCKGKNEEYNSCPPLCPSDDCSQASLTGKCPLLGRIGIVLRCKPTCRCKKGYWRKNGVCVPYAECKPKPSDCGINEERKCIQPCPPQKSCDNRKAVYFCPAVIRPCKSTCVCKPGYLRNAIGECITVAQCNKCSKPNEFYSCGSACDNECSTLGKQNRTNCPIINIKCNPKCYCKDGFARDSKGNCIPVDKCKQKPQPLQCGANEVVDDCPYKCGSENCPKSEQEANLSQVCVKPDKCPPPACRCGFNFSRDKNGKCISTRDCPPFPCKGKNEEYNSCPPLCPSDDCSQATPTGKCPLLGRIGIVVRCKPSCRCKKGYWRKNGVCVPYAECNKLKCKANEEQKCITRCPPQKTCKNRNIGYACAAVVEPCENACVCKKGYIRNDQNVCVPEKQCDNEPPKCGTNEEYVLSKSCPPDQCFSLVAKIKCDANEKDKYRCRCKSGFLRKKPGAPCEPICNCKELANSPECSKPPKCGPNEERVFGKSCPPDTCLSMVALIKCNSNEESQYRCRCKPGYLRLEPGSPCVRTCKCFGGVCDKPKPLLCGPNEEERCVKPCPPERTCRRRVNNLFCIKDDNPCQKKCVCKPGYFRNSIGQCISEAQCDQCSKPNEFFSCGSACDNECSTLNQQNRTHCPIINIKCNEKCYCDDGYARDDSGKCVPVSECKPPKPTCGRNEVNVFGKSCPPDTCLSLVAKFKCDSNEVSKNRCRCKPGYLRLKNGSACVPICQCPEIANSPECKTPKPKPLVCGPNEEVQCRKDCPPERTCRLRVNIFFCINDPNPCKRKCVCKPGYFRNSIGQCISEAQCDQCSKPHEFFSCGSACDNVCSSINRQNRTNCPIINKKCNERCYCDDGYARDSCGKCVPISDCNTSKPINTSQSSSQSTSSISIGKDGSLNSSQSSSSQTSSSSVSKDGSQSSQSSSQQSGNQQSASNSKGSSQSSNQNSSQQSSAQQISSNAQGNSQSSSQNSSQQSSAQQSASNALGNSQSSSQNSSQQSSAQQSSSNAKGSSQSSSQNSSQQSSAQQSANNAQGSSQSSSQNSSQQSSAQQSASNAHGSSQNSSQNSSQQSSAQQSSSNAKGSSQSSSQNSSQQSSAQQSANNAQGSSQSSSQNSSQQSSAQQSASNAHGSSQSSSQNSSQQSSAQQSASNAKGNSQSSSQNSSQQSSAQQSSSNAHGNSQSSSQNSSQQSSAQQSASNAQGNSQSSSQNSSQQSSAQQSSRNAHGSSQSSSQNSSQQSSAQQSSSNAHGNSQSSSQNSSQQSSAQQSSSNAKGSSQSSSQNSSQQSSAQQNASNAHGSSQSSSQNSSQQSSAQQSASNAHGSSQNSSQNSSQQSSAQQSSSNAHGNSQSSSQNSSQQSSAQQSASNAQGNSQSSSQNSSQQSSAQQSSSNAHGSNQSSSQNSSQQSSAQQSASNAHGSSQSSSQNSSQQSSAQQSSSNAHGSNQSSSQNSSQQSSAQQSSRNAHGSSQSSSQNSSQQSSAQQSSSNAHGSNQSSSQNSSQQSSAQQSASNAHGSSQSSSQNSSQQSSAQHSSETNQGNSQSSSQRSSNQSSSSKSSSSNTSNNESSKSDSSSSQSSSSQSSSSSESSSSQSSSSQSSSSESSSSQSSTSQSSSSSSESSSNSEGSSTNSGGSSGPLQCGANEEVRCVKSCPPQRTCDNRKALYSCPAVVRPCKRTCVCKPGYYRNALGTCITRAQCDQCSKPNEFFACDSACDNECRTIKTQGRKNCPIKNIVCNERCYCKDGYARDVKGNCVPECQCPQLAMSPKCKKPCKKPSH